MKYKAWLLAIAGCLASQVVHAGELTDENDEFRERRSVIWTGDKSANDLVFTVSASQATTSSGGKITTYIAKLSSIGNEARFGDCRFARWTIDGKVFYEMEGKYKLNTFRDIYGEDFTTPVTREALEYVASGQRVEYRACDVKGKLSDDDLEGLQRLLDVTEG
ncbi:hypothetical protein EAW52_08645 [Pseudomonas sp. LTJR-52]|uniref:hypothetical protein n=1 Tax=Pseudomonas sp. LTJR-52 TaxID=2479392 RepID=UPI000EFD6E38|nr:hypothetical protein [Pseudomonas sp. LTJR-52]AYN94032.1 hypothetical protein EAW52_08645 [Pseudomonas sp. LTJR-52]